MHSFSGYSTTICPALYDSQHRNSYSETMHKVTISSRKCFGPLGTKRNKLRDGRARQTPSILAGPSPPTLFVTHVGKPFILLSIVLRRTHCLRLLRRAVASSKEVRSVSIAVARVRSALIVDVRNKPRKARKLKLIMSRAPNPLISNALLLQILRIRRPRTISKLIFQVTLVAIRVHLSRPLSTCLWRLLNQIFNRHFPLPVLSPPTSPGIKSPSSTSILRITTTRRVSLLLRYSTTSDRILLHPILLQLLQVPCR